MSSPIMTVKELTRYLQISPSTIYKLLRKRQLPGFKIATDWRFDRDSIDRWRRNCEQQASQTASAQGTADGAEHSGAAEADD